MISWLSHDITDVCSNFTKQELPGDEDFEVAGLSRGSSLRDGSFAPSSQQLGDGWRSGEAEDLWSWKHWDHTMWGPPVISWFIGTSKYSYKCHKP